MAKSIPKEVVDVLKADPFMKECCICGETPQWHHNFEYGRKAVNEAWCILPLCNTHHQGVREVKYRRLLDWAMFNRAKHTELEKYSRVMNYKAKRNWLNLLFGDFSPRMLRQHYENNFYKDKTNIH
jgi:hypothetical protein